MGDVGKQLFAPCFLLLDDFRRSLRDERFVAELGVNRAQEALELSDFAQNAFFLRCDVDHSFERYPD